MSRSVLLVTGQYDGVGGCSGLVSIVFAPRSVLRNAIVSIRIDVHGIDGCRIVIKYTISSRVLCTLVHSVRNDFCAALIRIAGLLLSLISPFVFGRVVVKSLRKRAQVSPAMGRMLGIWP